MRAHADDHAIRLLNEDVYVYSNLGDEALADVWGYPRTLDYYELYDLVSLQFASVRMS